MTYDYLKHVIQIAKIIYKYYVYINILEPSYQVTKCRPMVLIVDGNSCIALHEGN